MGALWLRMCFACLRSKVILPATKRQKGGSKQHWHALDSVFISVAIDALL